MGDESVYANLEACAREHRAEARRWCREPEWRGRRRQRERSSGGDHRSAKRTSGGARDGREGHANLAGAKCRDSCGWTMRGVGQATARGCRAGLELIRECGCLCQETCERKERGSGERDTMGQKRGKIERGVTCGHSQGPVETVTSETSCNLQLLRHRPQPSKWVGKKPSEHACAKNETGCIAFSDSWALPPSPL